MKTNWLQDFRITNQYFAQTHTHTHRDVNTDIYVCVYAFGLMCIMLWIMWNIICCVTDIQNKYYMFVWWVDKTCSLHHMYKPEEISIKYPEFWSSDFQYFKQNLRLLSMLQRNKLYTRHSRKQIIEKNPLVFSWDSGEYAMDGSILMYTSSSLCAFSPQRRGDHGSSKCPAFCSY